MPEINFTQLCEAESNIAPRLKERAQAFSAFLENKGFHDLEFLGSGSYATVIAPKDSPDFVLRIFCDDSTPRRPIPYLLQSIGKWDLDIANTAGVMEPHSIEVLKRLDMDISPQEKNDFLAEASKHGSTPASLGRDAEIGRYEFIDSSNQPRKCSMASDPSCINAPRVSDYADCTQEEHHPSLVDQMNENIRIARSDSRLAEFIPGLEHRRDSYTAGEVDMYRSPREQATWEAEQAALIARVMKRLSENRRHPHVKEHEPGGRSV